LKQPITSTSCHTRQFPSNTNQTERCNNRFDLASTDRPPTDRRTEITTAAEAAGCEPNFFFSLSILNLTSVVSIRNRPLCFRGITQQSMPTWPPPTPISKITHESGRNSNFELWESDCPSIKQTTLTFEKTNEIALGDLTASPFHFGVVGHSKWNNRTITGRTLRALL
jgi:hypothetical protein